MGLAPVTVADLCRPLPHALNSEESMRAPRRSYRTACWLIAAVLLLAAPAGSASAAEAHFLLMFAAQRTPNQPIYSHSFASFVRVSWPGNGPCPPVPRVEAYTISWYPHHLPVRAYAVLPERGCNRGLDETIGYALSTGARVSLWGPFHIDGELYRRAANQVGLLTSGRVEYKMFDAGYSSDCAANCIHALSCLADGQRVYLGFPGWGEVASATLVSQFQPWILDRGALYPWVACALGLELYPIVYRSWSAAPPGDVAGGAWELFGGPAIRASYGPPH
jgi:hypothetical protein